MDENVKDIVIAVLSGALGVVGVAVGAWRADRSAARREAADRAFDEEQRSTEYIRERRRYFADAKLAALKETSASLAAMKKAVDQVMTEAGREQLSRVGNAVTDVTAKSAEFDLLFPSDLQMLRAQAAQALLHRAVLSENGVAPTDPQYQEAMKTSEQHMRNFEIQARVELGLEPELERPLTRKRQGQAAARAQTA